MRGSDSSASAVTPSQSRASPGFPSGLALHDDVVEAGRPVPGHLHRAQEAGLDEGDPGLGVGEDVRQLAGAEPDVDRGDHPARLVDPEVAHHEGEGLPVAEHEGDPLAGLETAAPEHVGEAVRRPVPLAERELPDPVQDRGARLGSDLGLLAEEVGNDAGVHAGIQAES